MAQGVRADFQRVAADLCAGHWRNLLAPRKSGQLLRHLCHHLRLPVAFSEPVRAFAFLGGLGERQQRFEHPLAALGVGLGHGFRWRSHWAWSLLSRFTTAHCALISRFRECSGTCSAFAPTAALTVGFFRGVLMAAQAVCLRCVECSERLPPQQVCAPRDNLQVSRSHTPRVPTEVIDVVSLRNRPFGNFVGDAMSIERHLVDTEPSVASRTLTVAAPLPTIPARPNKKSHALCYRQKCCPPCSHYCDSS